MKALVDRDAKVFLHQTGSSPLDKTFRSVEGVWVEDVEGHKFMDFQGNTCHNIGYRHPKLIEALKKQLDSLPFTPRKFTNEPAVLLAERLTELWPYGKAKVLFGLSGADAVEMALKLSYIATGRRKTLAFEDSWHGAALGAVWAGGRPEERVGFPEFSGCSHIPPFWSRNREENDADCANRSLEVMRSLLGTNEYACFLAEPIRSTPHIPPQWFWPEVRRLCDTTGTLLIFDEIPTGLGKTGRLFSSQHFDTAPDMTVLGKSLGGGALPLSALIARDDLNVAGNLAIGHYTHQKNPLLARAGLVSLDIIHQEGLVAASANKGKDTLAKLTDLTNNSSLFDNGRGIGLLLALQITKPSDLQIIQQECYKNGLHLGTAEGRFLCLSPPLTISEKELDLAIDILGHISLNSL